MSHGPKVKLAVLQVQGRGASSDWFLRCTHGDRSLFLWSHSSVLRSSARSGPLVMVSHFRNSPQPFRQFGDRRHHHAAQLLAGRHHQRAAAEGRLVAGADQRDAGMVPQKLRRFGDGWQYRVRRRTSLLCKTFNNWKTYFTMCCSHHSVDALDTSDSVQLEGKSSLSVENKVSS